MAFNWWRKRSQSPVQKSSRPSRRKRTFLTCEVLEDRQLLAVYYVDSGFISAAPPPNAVQPTAAQRAAPSDPGFVQAPFSGLLLGTNAFFTVTDAVNAANADADPSDTIYIYNGSYTQHNVTINKPMSIIGQSQANVIITPDVGDVFDDSSFGGAFSHGFIINSPTVTIQNLTVEGAGGLRYRAGIISEFGNNDTSLTVTNVAVSHVNRRGIQFSNVGASNTITNNTVSDVTNGQVLDGNGIAVFDNDALIMGNNVSLSDIGVGANRDDTHNPLLVVFNNTLTSNRVGLNLAALASGSLVSTNTINMSTGVSVGTDDTGIDVTFSVGTVTVADNIITGSNQDSGIKLFSNTNAAQPVIVQNNTITTTNSNNFTFVGSATGIFMSDNPDYFEESGGAPDYATITGNTITGFYFGVALLRDNTGNGGPQNVIATLDSNNISRSTSAPGSMGIQIRDADGNPFDSAIASASVTNSTNVSGFDFGIQVDGGFLTALSGNNIDGSTLDAVHFFNGGTLFGNNCVFSPAMNNKFTNAPIGIQVDGNAGPIGTLQCNDFTGDLIAINNQTLVQIQAPLNFYGNATGPLNANNPGGTGAAVLGSVNFLPFALDAACSTFFTGVRMGNLYVGGTGGNDNITVNANNTNNILVVINGHTPPGGPFVVNPATGRIVIYTGAGRDFLNVVSSTVHAEIHGGSGGDTIFGGSAGDVIFGGGGNDLIVGGSGNNFIVGEGGRDTIFGGAGTDILISGILCANLTYAQIVSILNAWVGGTPPTILLSEVIHPPTTANQSVISIGAGRNAVLYRKTPANVADILSGAKPTDVLLPITP
jgi:hypothetical protein